MNKKMTLQEFAAIAKAYKPLGDKAQKIMEERFERNPPDDYAGGIFIAHPGEMYENAIEVNVNYQRKNGSRVTIPYHVHAADLIK